MDKNKLAPTVQLVAASGLRAKQGTKSLVCSKDYTTSVKTDNQPSAETKALGLLRQAGFNTIQQLDWVGKDKEGRWLTFEIKEKELFEPGTNFPHWGAGLNKSQLWLRTQLLKDLGWRTYLLVFDPGTGKVFGEFLDELERKGGFYDTPKSRIRIYPLENFNTINNAPGQNLGGLR